MEMFCYQCEQTAKGTGCVDLGVCGKDPETAALQDLLVHAAKGVSMYAHRAAKLGQRDREIDVFVIEALFATVTNVDFDPQRLKQHLAQAAPMRRSGPAALRRRLCQGRLDAGTAPRTRRMAAPSDLQDSSARAA